MKQSDLFLILGSIFVVGAFVIVEALIPLVIFGICFLICSIGLVIIELKHKQNKRKLNGEQ